MSNEAKYRKIAEDEGRNFLTEYEFINLAEVNDEDLTESEMRRVHDIITRELRITPAPQIIRTPAELEALDPETIVQRPPQYPGQHSRTEHASDLLYIVQRWGTDKHLPAVVVASGERVRACREALEGGEA
ncbi:hypothetical protein PQI66_09955 [Corynebacterium sp. USCH3]|uniref:hypothetical protein n=1 Tax=Corynebacterium sp. USCH3 TaxID=3024840 RepID=UPI0030A00C77